MISDDEWIDLFINENTPRAPTGTKNNRIDDGLFLFAPNLDISNWTIWDIQYMW
jgi:hypothetical protein